MNKNELRAVMAAHGETYEDLAKVVGCTVPTLSDKINEKAPNGFNQKEMIAIKEHYKLSAKQVDLIFFGR